MAENYIKINSRDNVAVALEKLSAGETAAGVRLLSDVPAFHKFALSDIKKGEKVIKYGHAIGLSVTDIAKGEWVHTHNLKSNAQKDAVDFTPDFSLDKQILSVQNKPPTTFKGYLRFDGQGGHKKRNMDYPHRGLRKRLLPRPCRRVFG